MDFDLLLLLAPDVAERAAHDLTPDAVQDRVDGRRQEQQKGGQIEQQGGRAPPIADEREHTVPEDHEVVRTVEQDGGPDQLYHVRGRIVLVRGLRVRFAFGHRAGTGRTGTGRARHEERIALVSDGELGGQRHL